jgi:alkylation response protein AidB-like acyl-CoA dehydrogenase
MYQAPLKDLFFVLHRQLRVQQLAAFPLHAEYAPDVAESILEEAGKFASEILEPLNSVGDREGAKWSPEGVTTATGFRAAYQRYVSDGWPLLGVDAKHGGQGAPLALATAVEEIWFGVNVAFMLCPQLGRGAVEALALAGSDALRERFLPRMISGEWTGTMNLTEPQAGSDLAAIRTRAVPEGDHYRVFGQKIFITYGEHDLAENIVHLVLARIEGAPAGVKGISLFVAPKFLDSERNDLRCVSIEHKLGIHASPTCVMSFGDGPGAVGYLVGEANRGLEYMFIMMNSARLSVGVQGIGLSERAFQQAAGWARTRVQGRPVIATPAPGGAAATIIQHPDVRRMLLTQKSSVEAMRALAVYTALQLDLAHAADDRRAMARGELLIPIVKGWSTEQANDMASLAVQVHGGMGFIEETGVAQTLRDARITAIYEGTTAIQANDLLGRKLLRDNGAALADVLATFESMLASAAQAAGTVVQKPTLVEALRTTREALALVNATGTAFIALGASAPAAAYAVSVPFLKLCGQVFSTTLLVHGALIAAADATDHDFSAAKLQTMQFHLRHCLPLAQALAQVVQNGGDCVASARTELI